MIPLFYWNFQHDIYQYFSFFLQNLFFFQYFRYSICFILSHVDKFESNFKCLSTWNWRFWDILNLILVFSCIIKHLDKRIFSMSKRFHECQSQWQGLKANFLSLLCVKSHQHSLRLSTYIFPVNPSACFYLPSGKTKIFLSSWRWKLLKGAGKWYVSDSSSSVETLTIFLLQYWFLTIVFLSSAKNFFSVAKN